MTSQARVTMTLILDSADIAAPDKVRQAVEAQGGTILDCRVMLISPELAGLGFSGNLMHALVGADIDTEKKLTNKSEEELLVIDGVNYRSLYDIKTTLNNAGLCLRGERVEDFPGSLVALAARSRASRDAYRDLRMAGIQTIEQIQAMEWPELVKTKWWYRVRDCMGPEYPIKPTSLERPLADFGFKLSDYVTSIGIFAGRELTSLSPTELADRLMNAPLWTHDRNRALKEVRKIRKQLLLNGHDLREE